MDLERRKAVRSRYGLPDQFILGVGTLEPRKNFPHLISAYADLRRRTGMPHRLVIAGREGWMYEPIYDRVRQERVENTVQFLGYVADEDLPVLYNLAAVMAYPSLYEGFGIPPLEAMACGTPVVCSNLSSLPETVGDAALMVEPHDVSALSSALERVLEDDPLRQTLRVRGQAQAGRFTWDAAAEKLVAAYRTALA
jgi:glycosyltransferase involved in cell wall biosynthesis